MTKTGQYISDEVTAKDIKKRMIDLDLSVRSLAHLIGKSPSSVRFAIHHPSVVPHVRQAVLQKLNLAHA